MKIKVSPFGSSTENFEPFIESNHSWPESSYLQAGSKGIVLGSKGNYTTAFMEAFVDGTFIRGEGETIQEAEHAAWQKYQKINACAGHEWETRGYKNGAGFCKHCSFFKSHAFTGEELNQFCHVCKKGTIYSSTTDPSTNEEIWGCEEHSDFLQAKYLQFLDHKSRHEELTDAEKSKITLLRFMLDKDDSEMSTTDFLVSFFESLKKD